MSASYPDNPQHLRQLVAKRIFTMDRKPSRGMLAAATDDSH
ncbi:MAG: hypothetical protein OEY56_07925 [Cyclobacteriaceae bacterium]|nr:hypothetical protein [Cyclobacteriaceae bacterium]